MASNLKSVTVRVADGGRLMSDIPLVEVGAANYVTKQNLRRDGYGDGVYEVTREGWNYFSPNPAGIFPEVTQYTISSGDILAIGESIRPNGTTVPVAVSDTGAVYWFDYDSRVWTSIGTGYSNPPTGRRWQIINVGPYTVLNNGIDLPFTWKIGDAAVTPIYELREQGVASVGTIWEYNQVLMCGDILEIDTSDMSAIMNGVTPYAQITSSSLTQRIQYRIQWSNVGDPRDHAATVNAAAVATSTTLTLAWPMASFVIGDEITVIGAGASGGNHVTTIANIAGTALTMATPAVTTIASTPVQKTAALNSIVGFYEFEDNGSAVIRGLPLQNRLVIYKTDSIFVGYYTGDVDEPFVFERQYRGSRTPRFRWTLVDVAGRYHIFAGDKHFYRFRLGVQEPEIDQLMAPCEVTNFFAKINSTVLESDVYAADNGTGNEILFFLNFPSFGDDIIAYDYAHGCVSTITMGEAAAFTCAATIHLPMANETADPVRVIFVTGNTAGICTQFGRTNLAVTTFSRYGLYGSFESVMQSGFIDFGDPFNEKDVRSWVIMGTWAAVPSLTFTLLGSIRDNTASSTLETKSVMPANLVPLFYRNTYFQERISFPTAAVSLAGNTKKIQARIWEVGAVRSRGTRRVAAT